MGQRAVALANLRPTDRSEPLTSFMYAPGPFNLLRLILTEFISERSPVASPLTAITNNYSACFVLLQVYRCGRRKFYGFYVGVMAEKRLKRKRNENNVLKIAPHY